MVVLRKSTSVEFLPTTPALPFSGLGFDLAPVAEASCLWTLRLVRETKSQALPVWTNLSRPAGYELMIRLSREIRAG